MLQAGWKAVGFDIELSNYEWGTYLDMLAKSEKGDASSAQVFRMGWIADYPSLDNFLYPLFHSSQSATMYTFYNNPEFDDLVVQARQTTDETQRRNLYLQAEKLMLDGRAVHPDLLLPGLPHDQQPPRRLRARPDGADRLLEDVGQVRTRQAVCGLRMQS